MATTNIGIVYKNVDGQYMVYHETSTHLGTRTDIYWTVDIERATVFYNECVPKPWRRINTIKVPVKETRHVELI